MTETAENISPLVSALCAMAKETPETVNQTELMLYRHCREGHGGETALLFENELHTYQKVAEAAARCTGWLRNQGILPGDRIALLLPDSPVLATTYFGVLGAGAVAILLDPSLSSEDAFYSIQLCEARLAIVHSDILGRHIGLSSLPNILAVVGADTSWNRPSEFRETVSQVEECAHDVEISPEGYAYGLLSSGSTGRPKLIVHRHQDILHGHVGFARAVLSMTENDRIISVAKMTTGYGLGSSLLMPFLAGASTVLVAEPPHPGVITNAAETHNPTLLFAQPRYLAQTLEEGATRTSFKNLRLVICGGEPLSNVLVDAWSTYCNVPLLDSYGSTEVGNLYITNRPDQIVRSSVGRPIDGLEVQVTDVDGRPLPPGSIGRLRVRGPMVIAGYWNDPERTRQSFEDGWLVTSDLFSYDEQGFFFIHGRSDHMIKLGCGNWVNPIEIEARLLEHPAVIETAIVGGADEAGLTMLKAFVVVRKPGVPGELLSSQIGRFVEARWPEQDYKRIAAVHFIDALPKTAAGKLDRAKLDPQSMTEFSYKC